jgi:bacterial/archaeal transporter family protein
LFRSTKGLIIIVGAPTMKIISTTTRTAAALLLAGGVTTTSCWKEIAAAAAYPQGLPSHGGNGRSNSHHSLSQYPTSSALLPPRSGESSARRSMFFLNMGTSTPSPAAIQKGHQVISKLTRKAPLLLRGGAAVAAVGSTWLLPAMMCATSYALYNLFIKKASASIDPILGGVLLQFVAALVGTLLLGFQQLRASASGASVLKLNRTGIYWSIAAGVAVGAAEILSFVISGMGVPATQSIPIIIGGSILVGTLLGSVWLGESLSRSGWAGVLLIAAGIALVGMDPGSGVGH